MSAFDCIWWNGNIVDEMSVVKNMCDRRGTGKVVCRINFTTGLK